MNYIIELDGHIWMIKDSVISRTSQRLNIYSAAYNELSSGGKAEHPTWILRCVALGQCTQSKQLSRPRTFSHYNRLVNFLQLCAASIDINSN